jgi:hypothetical protein
VPLFDTAKIKSGIMERAQKGLQETAEFTLGRAKHHAPVRAVFKRTRRGKAFTNKGAITTKAAYQKFLDSKERRARVDVARHARTSVKSVSTTTSSGKEFRGKIEVGGDIETAITGSREQSGGIIRGGRRMGRGTSFSGHANSLVPTFREGNYNVAGEFRRIGPVPDVIRQRKGQASRVVRSETGERFAERKGLRQSPLEASRDRAMSSRGRYEFKQARLGTARSAAFNDRVGGRLRGEIRLLPLEWEGSVLWAYVESPTPYARHQEYGTTRHRAQPFMRPALYESRAKLRSKVLYAVKNVSGPLADVDYAAD